MKPEPGLVSVVGPAFAMAILIVLLLAPAAGGFSVGPSAGRSTPSPGPTAPLGLPVDVTSSGAAGVLGRGAGVPVPGPDSPVFVAGTLTGFARPPVPIVGANVTLVSSSCSTVSAPAGCPYIGSAITDQNGSYRIPAGAGQDYVFSHPFGGFGGDWAFVQASSGTYVVNLRAYPRVLYGNATLVLPGWNDLSKYASNCNDAPPCGYNSVGGTQVPLLSWTQDGAYYVNATDRLVFDSFATGVVREIAPWYPLYDDVMYYQGIENTEWITADDAYVYEFGCVVDCQSSTTTTIDFYAVNTTTGRTFSHNFTGVTDADCSNNAQIQMIGEDGNTSVAVLITASGTVYAYNLWNRTQWTMGSLPYFEANNIYWVPLLNSFVNVEAMGSSSDGISQVRIQGPAPGNHLATVFSGTYANGFTTNGVDGVYYNVTAHRLVITEANTPYLLTESFVVDRTGTLTGGYTTYPNAARGAWPADGAPPNSWSSEHRPAMASDAPMVMGLWNGLFYNRSWLFEPTSGGFLNTNLTLDYPENPPGTIGMNEQNGQSPAAVENLFVNSSYEILTGSVDCRKAASSCPIRGNATGTVPGTVWWTWRLGLPELPFPANVSGAETLSPGAVPVMAQASARSVEVRWAPPPTGANPVLNYTLFWGNATGAYTHSLDLWSGNSSAQVVGLAPTTTYRFLLQAWNLHWHNAGTPFTASTIAAGPAPAVTSAQVAPATVDQGVTVSWNVSVVGGLAPLEYTYAGLPPGCHGQNRSSGSCQPTAPGSFRATLNVSDAAGRTSVAHLDFLVVPDPTTGPVRFLPSPVRLGDPVRIILDESGGVAPFSWRASGLPPGCPLDQWNGTNVTCTPTVLGEFNVEISVVDALGLRSNATGSLYVVASPTPAQVGGVSMWVWYGIATAVAAVAVAAIIRGWPKRPSATARAPMRTVPSGPREVGPLR